MIAETKKLEEIATLLSGGTPRRSNESYWGGETPWVSAKDLKTERIYGSQDRLTEAGVSEANRIVPPGTVLFVVRGMSLASEFRVSLSKVDTAFNQDLKAVECSDEIDDEFLFYYLLSIEPEIIQIAGEASHGTKKLQTDVLYDLDVPVPALSKQKKIVGILSAFDDLIEVNRQRIERLERAARLLYREWFVHHRFPGHEHTEIVDGVPEGWSSVPLGSVLTLQRGFDLPTRKRNPGPVPVFAATGVTGYHDDAKVEGPGVVTGRSGSLGTVNYIESDYWPLNTTLWVKEFKRVPPLYAYHLLSEMNLEHYRGGAAVPTLNRNVVHEVEVLLPRESLMESFYNTVRPMYDQINVLKEQSERVKEARDILLPRLMSGEITV